MEHKPRRGVFRNLDDSTLEETRSRCAIRRDGESAVAGHLPTHTWSNNGRSMCDQQLLQ